MTIWTKHDIKQNIKSIKFAKNIKHTDIAQFNRLKCKITN